MASTGQISRLTSIVAIDRNGAIGCRNSLPWKLKTDMAFFKSTTLGHSVVMGRKTYDSIGKRPLPGRKNIVLSHNGLLFDSTSDCRLALSVEESLAFSAQHRSREVFVIGGAATYLEFANLVDRYLVTIVDHVADDADAFLASSIRTDFDQWEAIELESHSASAGQDQYNFKIYEIEAPDSEERRYARQRMIARQIIKKQKAVGIRQTSGNSNRFSQQAFSF